MKGSAHVLLCEGRVKNLDMFLLRKGNFIMINNSHMVKPEKLDYLHLVYHFAVPLNETYMPFLHCVSSFEGTSYENL